MSILDNKIQVLAASCHLWCEAKGGNDNNIVLRNCYTLHQPTGAACLLCAYIITILFHY
ncbi:MAG: hypothetical protein J6S96_03110 [Muribaculaceae bacterium]|nr:hypothetical protein [Muribaculaceae bacterium]